MRSYLVIVLAGIGQLLAAAPVAAHHAFAAESVSYTHLTLPTSDLV